MVFGQRVLSKQYRTRSGATEFMISVHTVCDSFTDFQTYQEVEKWACRQLLQAAAGARVKIIADDEFVLFFSNIGHVKLEMCL